MLHQYRVSQFLCVFKNFNIPEFLEKAFDLNFSNGFPGSRYEYQGKFGFPGLGFQFNGNGFNGYSFNSLLTLANGSIYNSATGTMINGFLVPSTSNSNNNNNLNFATNPGIDVRVG